MAVTWEAVVNLDRADRDQVLELIDAAWWIAAPARVQRARGDPT